MTRSRSGRWEGGTVGALVFVGMSSSRSCISAFPQGTPVDAAPVFRFRQGPAFSPGERVEFAPQVIRREADLFLVAPFQCQQGRAGDGRVAELFAEFDLLLVKADEVMAAGVLNRRMKRRKRLDDHLAFDVAPARPSGPLSEQLEGAFAGPEIRLVQAQIGVD